MVKRIFVPKDNGFQTPKKNDNEKNLTLADSFSVYN